MDGPFGLSGGARGVDDQRVVPGPGRIQVDLRPRTPVHEQLGREQHGAPRMDLFEAVPRGRAINQGGRRLGVA